MQDSVARALALKFIKGKADLVNGKVPQDQLPSFVSDVVEVDTYTDLPAQGEAGKIYVTTDTGNTYRWSGSQYVLVNEQGAYYSIKVDSTHITDMEALRTYVENINNLGLHCFFDFSDFKDNAYVCTVQMFTKNSKNYCLIFDLINGKKYIDYEGYQDDELVSSYINRSGDDLPTVIKLTDDAIKVEELEDMLLEINSVDHHVLFDLSILCDGCYLCTISLDIPNKKVIISDVTSGKIARMTYTSSTLVTDVLDTLSDIVDLSSVQTITGQKTFSDGVELKNDSSNSKWKIYEDASGRLFFSKDGTNFWLLDGGLLRPYSSNQNDIGTQFSHIRSAYINNLYGATQNASTDDIINGTFNVINASDISGTTLTQEQLNKIIGNKETFIVGDITISYYAFHQLILEKGYVYGSAYVGRYRGIYGTGDTVIGYYNINAAKLITLMPDSDKFIRLRNISQFNGKPIPNYPANNVDGQLVYRNNAMAWLDDTPVVDTTHTTFSGGLYSNKEYKFTQSLTSLTIVSLDPTPADNNPIWSVFFQADTGFALTTSGLNIQWKDETTPTFENGHIYQIMFKYVVIGEADYYLGICVDMSNYQG